MKIFLYVKQHKVTGLKYFGMTTKEDPYKYLGSGHHWRRHLKAHGYEVDTIELWEFVDQDECERFALEFSEKNKIVESKEWANIRPEHGRQGKPVGSPGMKGADNPMFGKTGEENPFFGKKHRPETIELYKKQKSGGNNPRARTLTTPMGQFGCVTDAAKAENLDRKEIYRRTNANKPGYHWGWN